MLWQHGQYVHVGILDEGNDQRVRLLGRILRSLDGDGAITLALALLFYLDVGAGGSADGIDIASRPPYYTRNGMHWHLHLATFH